MKRAAFFALSLLTVAAMSLNGCTSSQVGGIYAGIQPGGGLVSGVRLGTYGPSTCLECSTPAPKPRAYWQRAMDTRCGTEAVRAQQQEYARSGDSIPYAPLETACKRRETLRHYAGKLAGRSSGAAMH